MRALYLGLACGLATGCGTSLCNDQRDPDMAFCGGDRLTLDEAVDRARSRQPELADATLVRATSGATGTMNVDGRDTMWQLIFVVADGSDRTLTVTPGRTDVRPGGTTGGGCVAALGEPVPDSSEPTQAAVQYYEEDHGLFVHDGTTELVYFYEHECYDPANPGTTHVEIAHSNEVGTDYWFYRIDQTGTPNERCGPCDVGDIDVCTECSPL